jgi:thiol-disulfide isomerase/thioredoxin
MSESKTDDVKYKIILNFFRANDCPFCKNLTPIIEEIENDNDNDIFDVRYFDWDENRDICDHYNIEYVPTVTIELKDYEMKRIHGVKTKEEYQSAIDNVLEIYDLITNESEG